MIRSHFFRLPSWLAVLFLSLCLMVPAPAAEPVAGKSIPIARIKHSGPVDFEKEILPILKDNCLACHNQTKAKGALILETPQTILKGGDNGPAVVPKKPAESLLLKAAAHQDPEMIMPPPENKVAAANLTPEQLGVVQLWIEQGAKGEVRAAAPIVWQPISAGLKAIYAVALTRDGQYVACGRANQIFVYEIATGKLVARLNDPQLQKSSNAGAAHRDTINSLAFSPDGQWLASGGYRDVKLWRPVEPAVKFKLPPGIERLVASPDGKWLATASTNGEVRLLDAGGKVAKSLPAGGRVDSWCFVGGGEALAVARGKEVRFFTVPNLRTNGFLELGGEARGLACVGPRRFAAATEGKILVFTSAEGTAGWRLERELVSLSPVKVLAGSPTVTNLVATGGADGMVRIWNWPTGQLLSEVRHEGGLAAMTLRADGKVLATAGSNVVRLWKLGETKAYAELKGDGAAAFHAAHQERELNFAKGEVEFRRAALNQAETNRLNLAAKRQKAADTNDALAKALLEKRQALKNATEARQNAEKSLGDLGPQIGLLTEAVQAAEKESTNATAQAKAAKDSPEKLAKLGPVAEEKAARLAEARAALEKVPADERKKHQAAKDKVTAAGKAAKEAEKAAQQAAQTWELAAQDLQIADKNLHAGEGAVREAREFLGQAEVLVKTTTTSAAEARSRLVATEQPVRAVSFSTDGNYLATVTADGFARLWSGESGQSIRSLGVLAKEPISAALMGGVLVGTGTTGGGAVETSLTWNLERTLGSAAGAESSLADRINALRFTPDSQHLLSGGGEPTRGGELKLWRVKDGGLVRDFPNVHSDSVLAIDVSADGQFLASGGADRLGKIVEVATGKVLRTLEGHTHHVMGIAWKRDGRTVMTTGADNVAKLWDATTGERKKNIEGFAKEITAVSFVGAGDEVVMAGGDGQVGWFKEKGEKVRVFAGFTDYVHASAVSLDGSIVVAGGSDGVLRVWTGRDAKLLREFPAR